MSSRGGVEGGDQEPTPEVTEPDQEDALGTTDEEDLKSEATVGPNAIELHPILDFACFSN